MEESDNNLIMEGLGDMLKGMLRSIYRHLMAGTSNYVKDALKGMLPFNFLGTCVQVS